MILAPTCILLSILAPEPSWQGVRTLRRLPRVVIMRRPGIRSYERVVEELNARVRAQLIPLAPSSVAESELIPWLVRTRPDVVVTIGQGAHDRLVAGLAEPSPFPVVHTYVFGATRPSHDVIPARVPPALVFRALKVALPKIKRIGVLASTTSAPLLLALNVMAQAEGLRLVPLFANSAADAIGTLKRHTHTIGALWLWADLKVSSRQVTQYAVGLQFRRRLPLLAVTRRQVRLGALMSLDYEPASLGMRVSHRVTTLIARRHRRSKKDRRKRWRVRGVFGTPDARLTVNAAAARHLDVSLGPLRTMGAEVVH